VLSRPRPAEGTPLNQGLGMLAVILALTSPLAIYLASSSKRQRKHSARLQSRIAEIERARVACEVHDGPIQSLIGLEMEVAAWLLSEEPVCRAAAGLLGELQRRLRSEIVNLRTLTQLLRPAHLEPSQFLSHLSDAVGGFQRATGIAADFVSGVAEIDLPPRSCYEAARIVQEALTNVRKHSGATSVLVRFDVDRRLWSLSIEDNGVGFDFTGRRSHAELVSAGKGPAVIRERVECLGGELTIASDPGRGARLEIRVPNAAP
jgi:two-component system sensor histidine kinase DegS